MALTKSKRKNRVERMLTGDVVDKTRKKSIVKKKKKKQVKRGGY